MYTIIYTFTVKEGMEETFIQSWKSMTKLIYEHEGSLGSRLHKSDDNDYVAYAQWPDKEAFDNAGENLPKEANEVRRMMRESCTEINTAYKLEVVEDLLKS